MPGLPETGNSVVNVLLLNTRAMRVTAHTVTCMACAGPRAGQIWVCRRKAKDGWELQTE